MICPICGKDHLHRLPNTGPVVTIGTNADKTYTAADLAAAEERGRREGAKWRFPREPRNAGGWTIRYNFLDDIQGIINDEYGIGAEEIEQVLLAVEKLPVPPAEKEANCIFEKTYNENWGGINRTSFIGR